MEHEKSDRPFRVIVVGAGLVGLSLSHALQLANIEHVVLEKQPSVVSLHGAALMIYPGCARIFDQFGILGDIQKTISPITSECQRWPDGTVNIKGSILQTISKRYVADSSSCKARTSGEDWRCMMCTCGTLQSFQICRPMTSSSRTQASQKLWMRASEKCMLIFNRFDMPVILFDRQRCITHLYNSLPDQSRIRTNARVERIEHINNGVKVFLADGTVEEADIGKSQTLLFCVIRGLVGLPVCFKA